MVGYSLLIFIKNPILGKVKTRLAATVGNDEALAIYTILLNYTRRLTEQVKAARFLFYSDFVAENDGWATTHFIKKVQHGNDLGDRMFHAFEEGLVTHSKSVIIGSDCATLTLEIIDAAYTNLDQYDVVIGPANDGGYYLLGLKKANRVLFENIIWSSEQVLAQTIERINNQNLSYSLLPMLSDVDTEEDWLAVDL
ncbi:MAG: hypothetical protein RLZZ292_44 [Bacteroidota bacterium]|jgi:rSAM/selenodomain-associated transferase 1